MTQKNIRAFRTEFRSTKMEDIKELNKIRKVSGLEEITLGRQPCMRCKNEFETHFVQGRAQQRMCSRCKN